MKAGEAWWSREAVQTSSLFLLSVRSGGRHCFRGADKVVRRLGIEESQILEVVVFRRFEDVQRYAKSFSIFVDGVEEVEEDLEVVISTVEMSQWLGLNLPATTCIQYRPPVGSVAFALITCHSMVAPIIPQS